MIEGKVILHNADLVDIEGEVKSFFGSNYIKVTKVNGMKVLDRDWKIPKEREEKQMKFLGM